MSMFGKTDKLSDILNSDFWKPSPQMWQTRTMVKVCGEKEMSIIPPDGKRTEPLLKIEMKDAEGNLLSCVTMNLAAVDEEIGRLIKMRDILETMKPVGD